mmetsp:Transcript_65611/g.182492  ORF Transcript_65611/g.182492 Transcript_65611/m.182492 type:complete len:162 (-) Transcript_65611:217-702(-)|eukprot:CAMPEP_0117581724 /NCGR_PEP_ID=MMETSP0784-20121206/65999_1 /TAXON_ID=39447 /ORGANISM="" /LENGTH=161 /DNA_ID=CAMNT_0005382093 /DNA_START=49 /DNA_END=534 /DNA_ORIENTATION=-
MAPRGSKRAVTLNDAFNVDEDASAMPKDAKLSRNVGAMNASAVVPKVSGEQKQHPARYWQQQLQGQGGTASDLVRRDGTSSLLSTQGPLQPLPSASSNSTPSPLAAPCTSASAPSAVATGGSASFYCWLCKRRFGLQSALDCHVLHSKTHQESIRRIAGLL